MRQLGLLFFLLLSSAQTEAAVIVASDKGWYGDDGWHNPSNENYYVGFGDVFGEHRNWFLFDLSGLTETVTNATLLLRAGVSRSDFDQVNYQLTSTEVDASEIVQQHGCSLCPEGISIFEDLGVGEVYADTISDNDQIFLDGDYYYAIELNAAAIYEINSVTGNFVMSGRVPEGVFGDTNFMMGSTGEPEDVRLYINQVVPIPAAVWLFGSGLAALGLVRRRRQQL